MTTSAPDDPRPLLLRGGLICDGAEPPRPATLVLQAGRIAAVLPPGADAEGAQGAQIIPCAGHLITPGLMDVHTHLFGPGDIARYEADLLHASLPLRTLRGAANGQRMLDQGFTTVRDVCTEGAGYADVALRDAVAAGVCQGPRVVPSGRGVGITGGYLPMHLAPGVCIPTGCAVCDGAEAVRREVRGQVACGVDWIKVFADWPCSLALGGHQVLPTFTEPELYALVDEAARRGRRVAAHVTSDAGARQAIACGVASLEHLGDLSRETLDLAAARGLHLVPTLSVIARRVPNARDEAERDRAQREIDALRKSFTEVLAAGVTVASGSDIGAFPHEDGALSELSLLMDFGMTPLAALRAATRDAAALLRMPDLGVITPFAVADLCVFKLAGVEADLGATLRAGPPALVLQAGRIVCGAPPAP